MKNPVRTGYICKQCQRRYPSQEFRVRTTCVVCFMLALFESMAELNKKTLQEQKNILRKVEYGTQGVNAAIRSEIRTISKIIEKKE